MENTSFRNPMLWIDIPEADFRLKVYNNNIACLITFDEGVQKTPTANIALKNIDPSAWAKIRTGHTVTVYFTTEERLMEKPLASDILFTKIVAGIPYARVNEDLSTDYILSLQDFLSSRLKFPLSIPLKGKTLKQAIDLLTQDLGMSSKVDVSPERLNMLWSGNSIPSTLSDFQKMVATNFNVKCEIRGDTKSNASSSAAPQITITDASQQEKDFIDLRDVQVCAKNGYPVFWFAHLEGINNTLDGIKTSSGMLTQKIYSFRTLLNNKIRVGMDVLVNTMDPPKAASVVTGDIKNSPVRMKILKMKGKYSSMGELICEYEGNAYGEI